MNITLRKFLQDHRNRDLILVAGSEGMDNVVARVTVLDAPDGPSWLKGGELILTSTFLFNNDPDRLCSFCEQLIHIKACGFGLKMGRYLTKVPQSLIDLCDRNNFPLIIIPYSFVWTDLISIFYEMSYNLEREGKYSTLKSKLVGQIRVSANQGLEWIGEKVHLFFDTPMLFLDQRWTPLACCSSQAEQQELKQTTLELLREMPDLWSKKLISGRYYQCCRCILEKFGAHYVVFSSDSPNIIGELKDILIDARIIRDDERLMLGSEDDMIGQALPLLMVGEQISPGLLENLEQCIKQTGGYYCMLNIEACATQKIVDELKDIIRSCRFDTKVFAVYHLEKLRAVVLLRFHKLKQHCDAAIQLRQIMHGAGEYLLDEETHESIFVSNVYDAYKKLGQCWQEARLAEQYGRHMWPLRRLCYFEEVFPYYLMMNSDISPTYLDGLEKLRQEAGNTSFDCLQTLEAYLRYGTFKQAAQELFIHENTLRYRIKKIGDLLYADFDDIATRQNYVIRMNMWKLKQGLTGTGDTAPDGKMPEL